MLCFPSLTLRAVEKRCKIDPAVVLFKNAFMHCKTMFDDVDIYLGCFWPFSHGRTQKTPCLKRVNCLELEPAFVFGQLRPH